MKSTTAKRTKKELKTIFARQGLPLSIHTENDPQRVSKVFADYIKSIRKRHLKMTPWKPQVNEEAEWQNQTMNKQMKFAWGEANSEKTRSWHTVLHTVLHIQCKGAVQWSYSSDGSGQKYCSSVQKIQKLRRDCQKCMTRQDQTRREEKCNRIGHHSRRHGVAETRAHRKPGHTVHPRALSSGWKDRKQDDTWIPRRSKTVIYLAETHLLWKSSWPGRRGKKAAHKYKSWIQPRARGKGWVNCHKILQVPDQEEWRESRRNLQMSWIDKTWWICYDTTF